MLGVLSAFAVPLFYMTAGYYSVGCDYAKIKQRTANIARIFLVAFAVFFVCFLLVNIAQNTAGEWLRANFTVTALVKCVFFCMIDYAVPLWYLIAMLEIYILWLVVVKHKWENIVAKCTPWLFVGNFLWTLLRKLYGLPYAVAYNFIISALPWFLFGYYIRNKAQAKLQSTNGGIFIGMIIAGAAVAIADTYCRLRMSIYAAGVIALGIGVFCLAVRYANVPANRVLTYLGNRLSLYVYILHVPVSVAINGLCVLIGVPVNTAVWAWLFPIITLLLTLVTAWCVDKIKGRLAQQA